MEKVTAVWFLGDQAASAHASGGTEPDWGGVWLFKTRASISLERLRDSQVCHVQE